MPSSIRSEIHPLAELGVTATEIEKKTGGRVQRPNISMVLNGHRDRLGWASLQAVKQAFPAFDVERAMNWKWSEHRSPAPRKPAAKRPSRRTTS